MKTQELLESYKNGNLKNIDIPTIGILTEGMKMMVIDFINQKFIVPNLKNQNTQSKLFSNLKKFIVIEHNILDIPYFYILESLNLCIEVEMSDLQTKFYEEQKFIGKKLTDILNNGGFEEPEPIKKFAISEKVFLGQLEKLVESYTHNFEVSVSSIKIQIN
jgi:hypothetical protein